MNHNTALLLIDIQNDYFDGGSNPLFGSLQASENAQKILNYFRVNHLPVIHIQHIATRPGSAFFLPGTVGAEIHTNVQPIHSEEIIEKHYPNSFRETSLKQYLTNKEIDNLVICGMMTHMCVDATVRTAKDFGFDCTIISDACATKTLSIQGKNVDASDVHHSFLAALSYYYATVKTAQEFLHEIS